MAVSQPEAGAGDVVPKGTITKTVVNLEVRCSTEIKEEDLLQKVGN